MMMATASSTTIVLMWVKRKTGLPQRTAIPAFSRRAKIAS